jgi:hypothetical protein
MAIPLTIFFEVPEKLSTTFCYDKLPIKQCFENSMLNVKYLLVKHHQPRQNMYSLSILIHV